MRTATDFIKSFNEPTRLGSFFLQFMKSPYILLRFLRGLELVLERTSSVFKEASKENPVYCDISGPLYAVGGVVQDAEDKSMVTVRSLADDEVSQASLSYFEKKKSKNKIYIPSGRVSARAGRRGVPASDLWLLPVRRLRSARSLRGIPSQGSLPRAGT